MSSRWGRRAAHALLILAAAGSLNAGMGIGRGQAASLRAGAATANVTPRLGTSINGGMSDARATHIHDELRARCLVLDDGRTRLAIAVVDSCMLPRAVTEEARRLINAETGIPSGNVLISATHSHSCGTSAAVFQSEPEADYPPFVARRIADAVRCAANNLTPARAGWGSGSVPEEVNNRRWRMKPGAIPPNPFGGQDQVRMNPPVGSPDLLEPAGPTDPEVGVLALTRPDGSPIAMLSNYSLHYVGGVGPGHVSADYYGAFAAEVERRLGVETQDPPFVAIMSNGTSGDINNIRFRGPVITQPPYGQIRKVAGRLAAEAVEVHRRLVPAVEPRLAAASRTIRLRVRKPTAEEVEQARAILAAAGPPPYRTQREIYARETVQLADYPVDVPVMLQVLKIGELAICAIPCEVFVEIGLELKRRSPFRSTFTLSLANGYNGYLPTPEHHALGGYETWRAKSSYLEVDASRKITATLLELLQGLK